MSTQDSEIKIEAKEKTLGKIFDGDYSFQIPDYQRPYAWTKKETEELIDDISEAMENNSKSPYFLGSIVLSKVNGEGQNHVEVVDGQQRLTTLTILLCVLRDICEDTDDKNELSNYILEKGKKFAGKKIHFRLSVRDRKEFFEENIQKEESVEKFVGKKTTDFTNSQKCMHENAQHLWNKLNKLKDENPKKLEDLTEFLIRRCCLVVVATSSRATACRIFSVLNTRGLDLLPTDILKAEIIAKLSPEDREDYSNKWVGIEEELGRVEFRDLFSHIRMIHTKRKAKGTLDEEFQKGVLVKYATAEKLKSFIDGELKPMKDAYRIVSDANYLGEWKLNEYLKHLGRIDNKDWIPPAIFFFEKHKHDGDNKLLKFFRDLERLAYTLFILRKNVNERIARYAQIIQAIDDDNEDDLYKSLQLSNEENPPCLKR